MKLPVKITCVILIFALLISCVAATENKDLPTKEEITDFIAGIPVSDNYINIVFDAVKEKQPAWNCDKWVDKDGNQILSLYYVDPDSAKGYGSIYFNEFGNEISTSGLNAQIVESYVGKTVSEEQPAEEENQPVEKEVQSVEKEKKDETENKDLPTKEEITDFVAGIPVSDNYIITVFNAVKEKKPAWNCDIWVDKNGNQILSLYYVDSGSEKGYDSIYFNEFGNEISTSGLNVQIVESYVGKTVSEEQPAEEENQPVEEDVRSIDEERLADYEKRLADYEERLADYEEKQSIGYDQQTKYEVQPVDGEDQSAEYEELLAEYKGLLAEYKEINEDGSVNPPTEPEETKRGIEIFDGILVTVVGGVIVEFLKRRRGRRYNL